MASPAEDTADQGAEPEQASGISASSDAAASRSRPPEPPEVSDRVKPIVTEIRERVAELAAREVTLRKREQEFEQRHGALHDEAHQTTQREWADAQARLKRRSDELEAQSIELTTRRARLDGLEQQLARRQVEQEQIKQQIDEQLERLRHRTQAYQEQREEERGQLRQRIDAIRHRERELERRITLARDDILQRRKEFDERRAALDQRAATLENREKELQERHAGLERDLAQFQRRLADVELREAELGAVQVEVEDRQVEYQHVSEGMAAERQQLADKQRELDERWRQTRDERHQLTRQAEEIDARRRVLQEEQAAMEQRQQRLENYEQQLRGKAEVLETQARTLAEGEAVLAQRRGAVDALSHQADEALCAAQRQREQAEACENDNRQMQLSVELEGQELLRQRTALEQAQEELAGERARREADLAEVRSALQQRAAQLRRAERSALTGPRRWWLRSGLVGVAAGLLVGLAWWSWERPAYHVWSELRVVGPESDTSAAVTEHEQWLRTPGVITRVLEDSGARQVWNLAWVSGQVAIVAEADPPAVRISVEGPQRGVLETIMQQAGAGYGRLVDSLLEGTRTTVLPPELLERREALAGELEQQQQERRSRQARLESMPSAAERDPLREAVVKLRAEFDEIGQKLMQEGGGLATLMSAPVPRGTVAAADYETHLSTDKMYLEDLREFHAGAVQYRSELAVAMLLVVDPVAELRRVLGKFSETLAEQRELEPPTAVVAMLEQSESEVSAFRERLASFAQQWQASLGAIQAVQPERELLELVKRERAAHEEVRELGEEAESLADGLQARLDKLSEDSDGGTRAVVVAAVLRGEMSKLAEAVEELVKAVGHTDPAENFRLDALDRQLRGLRTRLDRRQAAVRQELQLEADERARQKYTQRMAKLRRTMQGLEEHREDLIRELSVRLDELRRLDELVAQRHEEQAGIRRCDAEVAILEQALREIDSQAAAPALPVEVGAVQVETIAGARRERNAALVGAGAFVVTCGLGLLMVVKNPLRRRARWEQTLDSLDSTTNGRSAD